MQYATHTSPPHGLFPPKLRYKGNLKQFSLAQPHSFRSEQYAPQDLDVVVNSRPRSYVSTYCRRNLGRTKLMRYHYNNSDEKRWTDDGIIRLSVWLRLSTHKRKSFLWLWHDGNEMLNQMGSQRVKWPLTALTGLSNFWAVSCHQWHSNHSLQYLRFTRNTSI